jgi:hypothetical protein
MQILVAKDSMQETKPVPQEEPATISKNIQVYGNLKYRGRFSSSQV